MCSGDRSNYPYIDGECAGASGGGSEREDKSCCKRNGKCCGIGIAWLCCCKSYTNTCAREKRNFHFPKATRADTRARISHVFRIQNGICSGLFGPNALRHMHISIAVCALCANINSERFTFASTDYRLSSWKLAWYRIERFGVCACVCVLLSICLVRALPTCWSVVHVLAGG